MRTLLTFKWMYVRLLDGSEKRIQVKTAGHASRINRRDKEEYRRARSKDIVALVSNAGELGSQLAP